MQRIDELQQTVTELAQAKQGLETSAQIKNHALSNAVHELRTPLVAVRGYVRMILDGYAGELTPQQREYLRIVSANADRLVELTKDLHRLWSSDQLCLETFEIRPVWRQSVALVEPHAAQKSVTIAESIPERRLLVTADRAMLVQVFSNLLEGAVERSEAGNRITVAFSCGEQGELRVAISDTGGGVGRKLLENSHAGEADRKEVDPGLAAARDIIRQHGGRILVIAKAGEGASLLFTLPAVRPLSREEAEPKNEQANYSRRR